MPIFRSGGKVIYYAHVPRCGGTSIAWYLTARFGPIAFNDDRFTTEPPGHRWSRTSPQHVDRASLARLFPDDFFDAVFTIVRHPVARLVSAYRFQADVEGKVPRGTGFSDWLDDIEERMEEDPFVFDNHVRPMDDMVPPGATVFHLEHGVDALVPWFDAVTGACAAPRGIPHLDENRSRRGADTPEVVPSATDLARIATLYAADFTRFGYRPEHAAPLAPAPEAAPEQVAARAELQRELTAPMARMRRKMARAFGRPDSPGRS